MYSLIIPVYKNEESIDELILEISALAVELANPLEVVFVVDGSPDHSLSLICSNLAIEKAFSAQVISLSRNFGSFAAIKQGMIAAKGDVIAVMAADLQEPISLIKTFFEVLGAQNCDLVLGQRVSRSDPFLNKIFSQIFWWFYRAFIVPEVPPGGVDIFGCNRKFRDEIVRLNESNTSLIGLLFWVGFRKKIISYHRLRRKHGKTAWTFTKKLRYFSDSIYSFTDLPVRLMVNFGIIGLLIAFIFALVSLVGKFTGLIMVPGYTTLVLLIMFFGGLNSLCLGILGSYLWRTYENTKNRPGAIIANIYEFEGK